MKAWLMKAWITSCRNPDEHGQEVVYAETEAEACEKGRELHWPRCRFFTAERSPKFDRFYPDGPTLRQLEEDFGWMPGGG